MRRLAKGAKPPILISKAAQWTAELLWVLGSGQKPTRAMRDRYRHYQIKAAVIAETQGKCAYCEAMLSHVAHGDIEHIIPKSKVPSKCYEWENLTLACSICNSNKGDEYSDDPAKSDERLIDPYHDDPNAHFFFLREIVSPRPDSDRAFLTESVIKLSRPQLIEQRRERMEFLDGLIRAYLNAPPEFKMVYLNDIFENHVRQDREFYASSNAYMQHLKEQAVIPAAAS